MTYEYINARDVFDDDNKGYIYGINWLDDGEVTDVEWFKTTAERAQAVKDAEDEEE
jgi:hypothetical protein